MSLRHLMPLPLLRALIGLSYWKRACPRELRSLVGRIVAVRDTRKNQGGVVELTLFAETASSPSKLSLLTIGRTASIQTLTSNHPWASDGDYLMALQGWNLGVSFAQYIAGNAGKDTAQALANATCMEEYVAIHERVLEALRVSSEGSQSL